MRTATEIVNSCIWKMIVDETGEVHKSSRSQMFFKIRVLLKIHDIHRKTPILESLLNKFVGLRAACEKKKTEEENGVH